MKESKYKSKQVICVRCRRSNKKLNEHLRCVTCQVIEDKRKTDLVTYMEQLRLSMGLKE